MAERQADLARHSHPDTRSVRLGREDRLDVEALRAIVKACRELHIGALTVFAFSTENWRRPAEEVVRLMGLFMESLQNEVAELNRNGVRLRFIGERKALSVRLQTRIAEAEQLTAANTELQLIIAIAYGGRWDIVEAARAVARRCQSGAITAEAIDEETFRAGLSLQFVSEPDLFIRTGGERRISNFLLWQLAYAELYFCEALWPDFTRAELDAALEYFAQRQRRFGLTGAQVETR